MQANFFIFFILEASFIKMEWPSYFDSFVIQKWKQSFIGLSLSWKTAEAEQFSHWTSVCKLGFKRHRKDFDTQCSSHGILSQLWRARLNVFVKLFQTRTDANYLKLVNFLIRGVLVNQILRPQFVFSLKSRRSTFDRRKHLIQNFCQIKKVKLVSSLKIAKVKRERIGHETKQLVPAVSHTFS